MTEKDAESGHSIANIGEHLVKFPNYWTLLPEKENKGLVIEFWTFFS